MRVSSSKSMAMDLNWKRVECFLQVKDGSFSQNEVRDVIMDWGYMSSKEGVAMVPVLKTKLSQKAKLFTYWLIFVPSLPYMNENWVVTKRMTPWIQPFEISFLLKGAGFSLIDSLRSFGIWESLE